MGLDDRPELLCSFNCFSVKPKLDYHQIFRVIVHSEFVHRFVLLRRSKERRDERTISDLRMHHLFSPLCFIPSSESQNIAANRSPVPPKQLITFSLDAIKIDLHSPPFPLVQPVSPM